MAQSTASRRPKAKEDLPEFTEETARTIVRALLVDYEHVILEELDRSYGKLRKVEMP
jgi:hypothetical protein